MLGSMAAAVSDYDSLIERYLDVCNQALSLNKNRFPFKQILGAAQKSEYGKIIEVNIIGSSPSVSYAMKFDPKGLVAKPHTDCRPCQCDRTWFVSADYLKDVARNPKSYIQNPAKINWEWMYDVQGNN